MKSLPFYRHCQRELLLHLRQPQWLLHAALFFLMVMVFFPLTMPPEFSLLRRIAPGLIWVATLLALLLASQSLFQQDYDEGILEQWLLSGYPLSRIVFAKLLINWLLILCSLVLFCPLMAVLFHFTVYEMSILMLSFLCGTPVILLLCALAAAFSLGLQQKGVLMALILFPLAIPVMILGSATTTAAMQALPTSGYCALLCAFSILAIGLLPLTIAAVLRIQT